MKELSIEEKAKAWDEALKEASIAYKDEDRHLKATLERIFPELKESEDEKIRKDLIEWFEEFPDKIWRGHYKKDVISWLEKQSNNPYNGVSFEYNGNTWGMCARDNGVDILLNRELIQHVSIEKQGE